MHNTRVAEWILGLVTSRDRAASTVGDLTEQAADRGMVWFWSGLLRTVTSLLWRDIADNPARVTVLAFIGLAVYIGIEFLHACLTGIVGFFAIMVSGPHLHTDSIGWNIWFALPIPVSSLLIGRILARWAPGRELAACVVFAIVSSIYNLVPLLGNNGALAALSCILIVAAATAWGRSRRLNSKPGSY